MSADASTYPDALSPVYWEKKKGSLPAGSDVSDKLKALQKKYGALEWKLFDGEWANKAKTEAELDEAYAQRERVYRSSVVPLKRDANDVANAARAMAKDKAAAKPTLEAAKAIGAAVNDFSDAIDAIADALAKARDKARPALAKDDDEDDEPGSALLDPTKLRKQLNLCKNDPERTMQFGFVDAKDKQPAVFAMHPRMTGKKLYAALQQETGVKTGAFGTAWVQVNGEFKGTCLMLQLDKPLSGLVKKVKAPVKAAGFLIAKAVLWSADGTVFEQEDETGVPAAGDEAPASGNRPAPPGGPASKLGTAEPKAVGAELAAFKQRLGALSALVLAAGDNPAAKQAKLLASQAGVASTKSDWAGVGELMKQAEALLVGVTPASPGGAPVAKPAETATHTAPVSPKVAFTHSRLAWEAARKKASADLARLRKAILDDFKDEPEFDEMAEAAVVLDGALKTFDMSLTNLLDQALNASSPDQQKALHDEAGALVSKYRAELDADELINALDSNPFVPVAIHKSLTEALTFMSAKLA